MRGVGQQRRLEQRQPQGGGKENLVGRVEVPAPAVQCTCSSRQATGSKLRAAGARSYGSSANCCGRRMGVHRTANRSLGVAVIRCRCAGTTQQTMPALAQTGATRSPAGEVALRADQHSQRSGSHGIPLAEPCGCAPRMPAWAAGAAGQQVRSAGGALLPAQNYQTSCLPQNSAEMLVYHNACQHQSLQASFAPAVRHALSALTPGSAGSARPRTQTRP